MQCHLCHTALGRENRLAVGLFHRVAEASEKRRRGEPKRIAVPQLGSLREVPGPLFSGEPFRVVRTLRRVENSGSRP